VADVIDAAALAAWLRDSSLADDASLGQIVTFTNALFDEEWANPTDPVPVKVTLLALSVAARAWAFDPSRANVESVSRSLDDASRTERYRTSDGHGGVYLTSDEVALLNGERRSRSVRLVAYGEV
jgi:hypothetical protein